jgi:protease I
MLAGKNIAILVANGFDENQMTEIQRALTKAKASIQTIAPEQGVVNGWQGDAWGHYFPVNAQIGEALGSDFDILVLPGGERSVTKLKTNLHTRRIIGHFLDANKPIATIGAGAGLLALSDKIAGRVLAASESVQAELKTAGAEISADAQHIDGNIFSADGVVNDWVDAALDFFSEAEAVMQAA